MDKINESIIELQTRLEELLIIDNKYIDLSMQLDDNMRNVWNEIILMEYELEKIAMSKKEIRKIRSQCFE